MSFIFPFKLFALIRAEGAKQSLQFYVFENLVLSEQGGAFDFVRFLFAATFYLLLSLQ